MSFVALGLSGLSATRAPGNNLNLKKIFEKKKYQLNVSEVDDERKLFDIKIS